MTRLAVIRPSAGNLFYMRLRLLYGCCKGATSYEDLMTAHRHDDAKANVRCDSFPTQLVAPSSQRCTICLRTECQ